MKAQLNHQLKLNVAENKFDMTIWSQWRKPLQAKTALSEFQVTTSKESTNKESSSYKYNESYPNRPILKYLSTIEPVDLYQY